jgi:hypothetical protein
MSGQSLHLPQPENSSHPALTIKRCGWILAGFGAVSAPISAPISAPKLGAEARDSTLFVS